MKLVVDERELETLNWSVGGFIAHGLEPKDRFTGQMEPPGGPTSDFTGQVTRVDTSGAKAVRFVEFDLTTLLALQDNINA